MKTLITLLLIATFGITANAEIAFSPADTIKKERSLDVFEAFGSSAETEAVNYFVRSVKELPHNFTGYKVEVMRVYHKPLSATDAIFTKIGGLEMEQINDYTYAYVVGNFSKEVGMLHYFENIIKPEYPNAKAVVYKKGVRIQGE